MFQSSPHLTARCNSLICVRDAWQYQVSILTSPYGKVQPRINAFASLFKMFQSSPHLTARCNLYYLCVDWLRSSGFNTHLTLRQGATGKIGKGCTILFVSILTSPYGKVQLDDLMDVIEDVLFQ